MPDEGKTARPAQQQAGAPPNLLNLASDGPLALSQDSTITMRGIVMAQQAINQIQQQQATNQRQEKK